MRRRFLLSAGLAAALLFALFGAQVTNAQEVIPFTTVEIECSEVEGEITESDVAITSVGQRDTSVIFSTEPLYNGTFSYAVDWDYYLEPDRGMYDGHGVMTPVGYGGTWENSFSGYWDADGGGYIAHGVGTGELAGMELSLMGSGLDFDVAMSMIEDDPRVVDGNPCYPGPMPDHGEAGFAYGQIVDNRSAGVVHNTALAHRYLEELWNEGNLEIANEILAEDFQSHNFGGGDREALVDAVVSFREENPNAFFPIEDLAVTNDRIYIQNSKMVRSEDGSVERESGPYLLVLAVENGKITDRWVYESMQ